MRVTKYRHACLLVEEAGARLLIDPGGFSRGFEGLDDLTAVLVTHQHADHVDADRLAQLLGRNPDAELVADAATAEQLIEKGMQARVARPGDDLRFGRVAVRVLGGEHATIHPDVPRIPNVGYLVGGRLLHPGDALTVPEEPVEVLCLPTAAPWLKAAEAVDYLRSVRPRLALPVHEAVLAMPRMYYGLFERLAPEGTEVRVIDDGQPIEA